MADAIKWSHNRVVEIDATFGSNNLKFPLFSLLAIDHFNTGIPFAWMVASREQAERITAFMSAVRERVRCASFWNNFKQYEDLLAHMQDDGWRMCTCIWSCMCQRQKHTLTIPSLMCTGQIDGCSRW